MKFFDLYPYIQNEEIFNSGNDEVIFLDDHSDCCWMCGHTTRFWSTTFRGPLCSEECVKKYWEYHRDNLDSVSSEVERG